MPAISRLGIESKIAELCQEAVVEPLSFFSEADLQARLYGMIRNEWPEMQDTGYPRGVNDGPTRFKTPIVHREYGVGGKQRMDLTVFDPGDLSSISNADLKADGEYLRPLYGIELGTEKSGDSLSHLLGDISKVSLAKERGYVVHLFRDTTVSDVGTRRNDATEERVVGKFRESVADAYASIEDRQKVAILAIVIRIRRMNRDIRGRCEMFFPRGERNGLSESVAAQPDWFRINILKIAEVAKTWLAHQAEDAD